MTPTRRVLNQTPPHPSPGFMSPHKGRLGSHKDHASAAWQWTKLVRKKKEGEEPDKTDGSRS
jgi:hypothetical protein